MGVLKARRLPADDAGCGWFRALPENVPEAPAPRPLAGDLRVGTALVGAGFTGLAAARRLAALRPDEEVALVDAQRAGHGAAGRSSGFVVELAGFVAALSPEDGERFVALSRLGIRLLRERVEADGFDCAWDDAGWLHVAATEPGLASLASLQRWLDQRGATYVRYGEEGMRGVVGSGYYRAGLRLPGSVLVQPAALVRGLVASLPETVRLYEETPVVRIRPGRPVVLETPHGTITADRAIVATNGQMGALGLLRQRVFPLWTFGSLTRPLTDDEQRRLGGESEWGVLAQDVLGSSLRRTRDQRILVRNTVKFSRRLETAEAVRDAARAEHRRAFLARFPDLAEVGFDATWGGLMGMSLNGRHFFGQVEEGVYAAAGYNAAGIALGTVSGHLLAEEALGEGSAELEQMRALPNPRWFPPSPFSDLGIRWRVRAMERASGGEI
jgi:glycine/D-amino acid oxidase-like deaminating enzyme